MSNQLAGAAAISRAQGLTKISAQTNVENQNQKNDLIKLMKENEVLRKKLSSVNNENLTLQQCRKKQRDDRNKCKNVAEKLQVTRVVKNDIIPKCSYIANRTHHLEVMKEICTIMNVSEADQQNFVFLYELDVLHQLSQYRNNASQQMKKKLKGKFDFFHIPSLLAIIY